MLFLKKYTQILSAVFLLLFFTFNITSAEEVKNKSIIILSWWDYLEFKPERLKDIEQQCHVNIYVDNYYSSDEFLKRFKSSKSQYDILIFSDTISKVVNNEIAIPQSTLYKIAIKYHPVIYKHYMKGHYPHNVAFFLHSLTGFLYNPNNLNIYPNDSLKFVFKKTGSKIVAMLDDPTEVNLLVTKTLTNNFNKLAPLNNNDLKAAFQNAAILITNSPDRIISSPDFALAFQWSGEAISLIKKNPNKLNFLIAPHLSYISTDLIAENNLKPETICVTNVLSGKKFLASEQNVTYYFSPYCDTKSMTDPLMKYQYEKAVKELNSFSWIQPLTFKKLNQLNQRWAQVKLDYIDTHKNKK